MQIETKFDKYNQIFFTYKTTEGYAAYKPGEIQGINFLTKFNENYMDVKISYFIWYDPIEHNTRTTVSEMEVPENNVFKTEKEAAATCAETNHEILEKIELQRKTVIDKIAEQEKVAAK